MGEPQESAAPAEPSATRQIDVWLHTGFAGATHEDTLTVESDATDDQIEEHVREWAMDRIDFGWKSA